MALNWDEEERADELKETDIFGGRPVDSKGEVRTFLNHVTVYLANNVEGVTYDNIVYLFVEGCGYTLRIAEETETDIARAPHKDRNAKDALKHIKHFNRYLPSHTVKEIIHRPKEGRAHIFTF